MSRSFVVYRVEKLKRWWAPVASLTAFLVLIRTVAAVIGTITHPVGGDAAVVCTLELGGRTKFVCKGCQKEFIQSFIPSASHVFHVE